MAHTAITTSPDARLPPQRATTLAGVRDHNERLVLTLLRQQGPLPKAQIARVTGLSAQTASVIVRELEADGLVIKGEPQRGRVGQPSVPIALAPNGAFFFGLKIGRRSAEVVLTDFAGRPVGATRVTYAFPTPSGVIGFAEDSVRQLEAQLAPGQRARVAGLGIAMPFRIWDWARTIGLPEGAMDAWRDLDVRRLVEDACGHPVLIENDATAACGAELVFGTGAAPRDFLYFYVGYFIGGGLVLDHRLFVGRTGNAAALGSMPVPGATDPVTGGVAQLIDVASLSRLDARLAATGHDGNSLWGPPDDWTVDPAILATWTAEAGQGIAHAIAAAAAVIDVEAALIDGWMPADVRAALVQHTGQALARMNLAGIRPPQVRAGSVGPDARVLGAASLPLSERFLVRGDTLSPAPDTPPR
ncbi:MAG: ROK family transcriptional regulator [Rhodobacteraceae bacterium]|nr:ROK family transcriptional regulator [Paracoccaceae bacterium]